MPPAKTNFSQLPDPPPSVLNESGIEALFIWRLQSLKYEYRPDTTDRSALERDFSLKFEELNRGRLTNSELARLLDEIVTPDVFTASKTLRAINTFTRDDGTPLNYARNKAEGRRKKFERVPLRHSSFPLLSYTYPRRVMEQIVEYKNDSGNGYTETLLCFLQLFIVSNRDQTFYSANNNARHFPFNADERLLPLYEFADEANKKIRHLDEFADCFLKKCDLGRTISRQIVLIASEQKLLIMRTYQVYAVQRMVKCIEDDSGNGYVWHTIGNGKTLNSFKASTLLKDNPEIEKCLTVVDRRPPCLASYFTARRFSYASGSSEAAKRRCQSN